MSKLRELELAATPGPWHTIGHVVAESVGVYGRQDGIYGPVLVFTTTARQGNPNEDAMAADAALTVALRNAARSLLDVVDAAREAVDDPEHPIGMLLDALARLEEAMAS